MSRHVITNPDNQTVAYGFDRMLQEFFCCVTDADGQIVFDSGVAGERTSGEIAERLVEFGVWEYIPQQHRFAIAMDMLIVQD